MPKVSVIMPVYNTERFVGEAIESILDQTFQDFEFIIIDDCSTDNSWNIIQEYSKKDGRIIAQRNDKNMGISYTRNKLIKLTCTNYIASQDSDDISLSDRLEVEFEFLNQNQDFGAVSGHNIIINEESRVIGERIYSQDIKNTILKMSPLSNPASLFRKDIFDRLGGYEEGLNYGEDYDLWLRMYLNGHKLGVINHHVLKLRIRKGQTKSSKLKETIRNTIHVQKKAIKRYGVQPSTTDIIYIWLEHLLLILPDSWIIRLFQALKYKKNS